MSAPRQMLCTLGPSSLNERVIAALDEIGADRFRINMSHTAVENLERILRFIHQNSKLPVSIDTEGARLRTGRMTDRVTVFQGGHVRLVPEAMWGDAYMIPIVPGWAVAKLVPGTRVSIDFDAAVLRVDEVADGVAEATVLSGGDVGSRKAVTALPSPALPSFSDKDRVAIRIARENGVHEFSLSFCEHPDTVREMRTFIGPDDTIVAKIESSEGVRQLDQILGVTDKILIDRGDLSREVRVQAIPMLQKAIVHAANARGVPVYVATHLLESMITRRVPTQAEVNDVMNTLIDGADGLVLTGETATGSHPVEAAQMLASLLLEFARASGQQYPAALLGDHPLAALSDAPGAQTGTEGASPRSRSPH